MGLDGRIAEWRGFVQQRDAIAADVDELEAHLRDQIEGLEASGLSPDEAFLIAVGRLGQLDALSREFAREHSERLWKQLVLDGGDEDPRSRQLWRRGHGLWLAVLFAVAGAVLVKLPWLIAGQDSLQALVRNVAPLLLLAPAGYFLRCRRAPVRTTISVLVPFAAALVLLNAYPFAAGGATVVLAAGHAVVVLWLCVGLAYVRGDWRSDRARMDFIRFTGEWFVYLVLLGLGGGVLAAVTASVFHAVGLDATGFITEWLLPCGAAGAVVIAAWLVEAKQAVIENIAPVLTRVFTPLFTLLLLALIVAAAVQIAAGGGLVDADRTVLITFDAVLIVVVGLLLYSLSAREGNAPPGWFDRMQFILVASAIVVDAVVLVAMLSRIGAFGASPNKVASLGLNVILLVNLVGSAWLQARWLWARTPRPVAGFARIERWQTGLVPVYLAWAAIVVVAFPPVFGWV